MRKSTLDALFPKTRHSVLTACLLQPEKWWYLSDLAGFLKLTPSTLQRELASLTEAQILESRKEGNRVYYKANTSSPGIQDLQMLLIKTSGIVDLLKSTLKNFLESSHCVLIYGSMARGDLGAKSDVDLMLIGDSSLSEMSSSLKKAEKMLGREVNPTIYSRGEFVKKLKNKDAFIKTVMNDEKIFLKGTDAELKKMAK